MGIVRTITITKTTKKMACRGSLITAWEVVLYSPVKRDFPTAFLCNAIKPKELKLFRECLGNELYEALIDDLVPYDDYEEYNSSNLYSIGDVVLLDTCLFVSKINSNSTNPYDTDTWELGKKFERDCYNELWECHLRPYLAYMVIYTTINYVTTQAGAKGIVKFNDGVSGEASVHYKALFQYEQNFKRALLDDANDMLENMKEFMKDNPDCFPDTADACGNDKCKVVRRRRIAYKR